MRNAKEEGEGKTAAEGRSRGSNKGREGRRGKCDLSATLATAQDLTVIAAAAYLAVF